MEPRPGIRTEWLVVGVVFVLLVLLLLLGPLWPSFLTPVSHPYDTMDLSVLREDQNAPAASSFTSVPDPKSPNAPVGGGAIPEPTPWAHPALPLPFPTTGREDTFIPQTPPAANLTEIAGYIVAQADYEVWRYSVLNYAGSWGDLLAWINYDTSSVESIQAYAAANRALVGQLGNAPPPVRVDVTFRTYLAPDDFRAWVQRSGLRPAFTSLRTMDQQGQRANLVVEATEDDPLPPGAITQRIAAAQAQGRPITVPGVIYVTAEIDPGQLAALSADPLVFLADVTPNILLKDLQTVHPDVPFPALHWVRVNPESPFLRMEDLGLEYFR